MIKTIKQSFLRRAYNMKRSFLQYLNEKERDGTQAEKEVRLGISSIKSSQNKDVSSSYTNTGKRGKSSNFLSDVLVKYKTVDSNKEQYTMIEVKSNSSAEIAHWSCTFKNNKLLFEFPKVKKFNNVNDGIISDFNNIISTAIHDESVDRLTTLATNLEKNINNRIKYLNEYYERSGIKGKNIPIQTNINIPDSLKILITLFDQQLELHLNNYNELCVQIKRKLYKQNKQNKLNLSEQDQKNYENFVKFIKTNKKAPGNISSYEITQMINILKSNFLQEYIKKDNTIQDDIENIQKLILLFDNMFKALSAYKSKRKNIDIQKINLNNFKDYEKIYYSIECLLFNGFSEDHINVDDIFKDTNKLDISRSNYKRGIKLEEHTLEKDKDEDLFNTLTQSFIKYYHDIMHASYIQIGNEVFNLSTNANDPLDIENQIRNFSVDNISSIHYLFQIDNNSVKNDDSTKVGLSLYAKVKLIKPDDKFNVKSFRQDDDKLPTIGDKIKDIKSK